MDYEVIVGNIGTVYRGKNAKEARKHFRYYTENSKAAFGRGACEDVTLFRDGDIESEHLGSSASA